MKICHFKEQGQRANNEDYFGYNDHLWMVCDGIGGHVSGERASQFIIEDMLKLSDDYSQDLTKNRIVEMINQAQNHLNLILDKEPEYDRMGTTFTGVYKSTSFWFVAHIGDSRVYLFRPKEQRLWHTTDDSLVGKLMAHHDITREEGRFHPMSNRIDKAILANFEQNVQTATVTKIDELKAGDIFMLCTDGVMESWGDHELIDLFSDTSLSLEVKCALLKQKCMNFSRDNNTALLIEIEEQDAFQYGFNEELHWVSFQEIKDDYDLYLRKQQGVSEGLTLSMNKKDGVSEPTENPFSEAAGMSAPDILHPDLNSTLSTSNNNSSIDEQKKNEQRIWLVILLLLCIILVAGIVTIKHFKHTNSPRQENSWFPKDEYDIYDE